MRRFFLVVAIVFFCAAVASAQTKISGTVQCGKPDPQHTIPAGDSPEHTLGVEQAKCTWSKPAEIGGDKSKDAIITSTTEITGDLLRVRGVSVTTMESGEKALGDTTAGLASSRALKAKAHSRAGTTGALWKANTNLSNSADVSKSSGRLKAWSQARIDSQCCGLAGVKRASRVAA